MMSLNFVNRDLEKKAPDDAFFSRNISRVARRRGERMAKRGKGMTRVKKNLPE